MTGTDATIGMAKVLARFSDPYVRQARLVPALLTIVPAGISDTARRLGKAKEKSLWSKWGGMPSMQILRHRDSTFDVVSTKRYHATLATKMREVFPTEDDEKKDPDGADAMYVSACNMLRNKTTDTTKFKLLFANNVSYGFRRNGLGLRGIGITVCVACVLWVWLRPGWSARIKQVHDADDLQSFFNQGEWIALGVALLMLLFWLLFFTEKTAKEAAFTYAKTLIEACERIT